MATTISTQDIVDAKRDIDDIGKAVNENVIVSPRYGDDFKSLPMIAAESEAALDNFESTAQDKVSEWDSAINLITQEGGIPALAVSTASGENQQEINDYNGTKWRNKAGGYGVNARVMLESGDIVKSTVAGNTTNPNVDMTGWINANDASFSSFKQPDANAIDTTVLAHLSKQQFLDEYSTPKNAVDAKRSNVTDIKIPAGTHPVTGQLVIGGYVKLEGAGDGSVLKFEGSGNGINYTSSLGVLFDDHAHRQLRDFRIQGDGTVSDFPTPKNGTTIGYQFSGVGHYSSTEGLSLDRHGTGMKISNAYTNNAKKNYYRANKIGLHLNSVTSHREELIYARFNSEAAVLIEGGSTQNITFAGGAIEGNRGRGLWVKNLPANWYVQLQLDDLYMESNGDLTEGVPATDVQSIPNMHITVTGGNYWQNNVGTVRNGIYDWGNSISFEGSSLDGFHYAKYMSLDKVVAPYGLNSLMMEEDAVVLANKIAEPTIMLKYNPHTIRTHLFQVPFLTGITKDSIAVKNTCRKSYPYNVQSYGVSVTENTSLDYGEGSWDRIVFSAVGNYSNNYVELQAVPATANTFSLSAYLFRPEVDCIIGFAGASNSTNMRTTYRFLANKTYKIVIPKPYGSSSSGTDRLRIFMLSGTSAILNVKPLLLSTFTDKDVCLAVISQLLNGTDGGNNPTPTKVTYDPPSLATGQQQSTTVTVNGAVLGDMVSCSFNKSLNGSRMWAEVTAANTVTVYHRNDTGATLDIASGTLTVSLL